MNNEPGKSDSEQKKIHRAEVASFLCQYSSGRQEDGGSEVNPSLFLAIIMAFGIGLLAGGRYCGEDLPSIECPEAPLVVCPQCPQTHEESVKPEESSRGSRTSAKRAKDIDLPSAPPPESSHREQLLAWVQKRSSALGSCGGKRDGMAHLVVTLRLASKGVVEQVEISYEGGTLPRDVVACLRSQMLLWEPPEDLVGQRGALVFGLRY